LLFSFFEAEDEIPNSKIQIVTGLPIFLLLLSVLSATTTTIIKRANDGKKQQKQHNRIETKKRRQKPVTMTASSSSLLLPSLVGLPSSSPEHALQAYLAMTAEQKTKKKKRKQEPIAAATRTTTRETMKSLLDDEDDESAFCDPEPPANQIVEIVPAEEKVQQEDADEDDEFDSCNAVSRKLKAMAMVLQNAAEESCGGGGGGFGGVNAAVFEETDWSPSCSSDPETTPRLQDGGTPPEKTGTDYCYGSKFLSLFSGSAAVVSPHQPTSAAGTPSTCCSTPSDENYIRTAAASPIFAIKEAMMKAKAAAVATAMPAHATTITPPPTNNGGRKKIVVVDDAVQHLLANKTEHEGYVLLQGMVLDLMREVDQLARKVKERDTRLHDLQDERNLLNRDYRENLFSVWSALTEVTGEAKLRLSDKRQSIVDQLSGDNKDAVLPVVEATQLVVENLTKKIEDLNVENTNLLTHIYQMQEKIDDLECVNETRQMKIDALEIQFKAINNTRKSLTKKLIGSGGDRTFDTGDGVRQSFSSSSAAASSLIGSWRQRNGNYSGGRDYGWSRQDPHQQLTASSEAPHSPTLDSMPSPRANSAEAKDGILWAKNPTREQQREQFDANVVGLQQPSKQTRKQQLKQMLSLRDAVVDDGGATSDDPATSSSGDVVVVPATASPDGDDDNKENAEPRLLVEQVVDTTTANQSPVVGDGLAFHPVYSILNTIKSKKKNQPSPHYSPLKDDDDVANREPMHELV